MIAIPREGKADSPIRPTLWNPPRATGVWAPTPTQASLHNSTREATGQAGPEGNPRSGLIGVAPTQSPHSTGAGRTGQSDKGEFLEMRKLVAKINIC